jgi:hypothetical protein
MQSTVCKEIAIAIANDAATWRQAIKYCLGCSSPHLVPSLKKSITHDQGLVGESISVKL